MKPLRGPVQWFALLVIVAVALSIPYAIINPWALHIGGRSTPGRQWDGLGQIQASNGGRYVLFTHLEGGAPINGGRRSSYGGGSHGKSDNLHGSAELCTESGAVHTFKLTGVVDGWWTTDGAPTTIGLTGGAPVKLQGGWVVAWHGAWRGPALELSTPDNSFTEAFTPRGEIRRVTSTADAGTARVTLQYGSHDDFTAACRALTRS
ncbi:MAG TPA: hypothetical protein VIF57_22705 [Polyangia bacterium]|jgi:hypothetical protein